jgi:hypothetical protein
VEASSRPIWIESLTELGTAFDEFRLREELVDAVVAIEFEGGFDQVRVSCRAILEINPEAGFDLFVEIPPGSAEAIDALFRLDFGASEGRIELRADDRNGVCWTARSNRVVDGRFDMPSSSATFRLSPNVVDAFVSGFGRTEPDSVALAVDCDVFMPPVLLDLRDGPDAVTKDGSDIGVLITPQVHVRHTRSTRYRHIRVTSRLIEEKGTDAALSALLDAVSFVNGRRVAPRITRTWQRYGCRTQFFRRRDYGSGRLQPILHVPTGQLARNAWDLFHVVWLRLIAEASGEKRSAMARCIAELHASLDGQYISTKALLASVAVEALVKMYCAGPPPFSSSDVKKAKRALESVRESLGDRAWQVSPTAPMAPPMIAVMAPLFGG